MAAILDLSNQKYMALAIRGPNLVLLGRFEQFGGKYGLSPLTTGHEFICTPGMLFCRTKEKQYPLDLQVNRYCLLPLQSSSDRIICIRVLQGKV